MGGLTVWDDFLREVDRLLVVLRNPLTGDAAARTCLHEALAAARSIGRLEGTQRLEALAWQKPGPAIVGDDPLGERAGHTG